MGTDSIRAAGGTEFKTVAGYVRIQRGANVVLVPVADAIEFAARRLTLCEDFQKAVEAAGYVRDGLWRSG